MTLSVLAIGNSWPGGEHGRLGDPAGCTLATEGLEDSGLASSRARAAGVYDCIIL